MPELPFKVIAASESDEKYPPENLVTGRRSWRGKAGIDFNYVILKLTEEEEIRSIDIGNDGSAYVSVSVARSCEDMPTYNCLISENAFMDPGDSRMERNLHRVKIFTASQMNTPFSSRKWDLIKIICKQPYNRRIPCGLSFIQLVGGDENKSATPLTKLGIPITTASTSRTIFDEVENRIKRSEQQIRDNEQAEKREAYRTQKLSEENMEKAGHIKAKKRAHDHQEYLNDRQEDVPICSASGIVLDSKGRLVNSSTASIRTLKKVPTLLANIPCTSRADRPDSHNKIFTPSKILQGMMNTTVCTPVRKEEQTYLLVSPKRQKVIGPGHSTSATPGASSTDGPLVGVTFSLSGFENPLRGELREKGTTLGAAYVQNINVNLTHLVCAFKNTPKARKAGPSVKVVSNNWIEGCFDQNRRLKEDLYKI